MQDNGVENAEYCSCGRDAERENEEGCKGEKLASPQRAKGEMDFLGHHGMNVTASWMHLDTLRVRWLKSEIVWVPKLGCLPLFLRLAEVGEDLFCGHSDAGQLVMPFADGDKVLDFLN